MGWAVHTLTCPLLCSGSPAISHMLLERSSFQLRSEKPNRRHRHRFLHVQKLCPGVREPNPSRSPPRHHHPPPAPSRHPTPARHDNNGSNQLSHNRRSWQGSQCCHYQKPTGRIQEEEPKGHKHLPSSRKPSGWNPSWLRDEHTTRKDPESDQIKAGAR